VTSPATSTDPLVEVLATRLRRMDLVGWQRIAAWAEQSGLSFEDLRLLLALEIEDGPAAVSELADLSGLSLHAAYPAIHDLRRRGYLREEGRRYALTDHGGDLITTLDAAHRDGIQAYVDDLDPDERRRLDEAFGIAR
jgi:DNA-binding MarR family transcriptional regulator